MEHILELIHSYLWETSAVFLILISGIYLSFKTRFIQLRGFKTGLKLAFKKSEGEGDISSFSSLCTSLAACIGTGNIAGVAIAVSTGGAGAAFWMMISAFFGMATKYAEGFLGLKYREKREDGFLGGPFLYIEKGLGRRFRPLSLIFAFFGMAAGLIGIGGIAQINTVALSLESFLSPQKTPLFEGFPYSSALIICGLLISLISSFALLGGIKRIAAISSLLVPIMSIAFVFCSVLIIFCNLRRLGDALTEIISSAFSLRAGSGAMLGICIKEGIGRGVFSNEAGIGTSSISAAASKENEPAKAGLIAMTGAFIDTILLCSLTALAIVLTNSHKAAGLEGAAITTLAFEKGLPFPAEISAFILNLCLFFFGFTSVLGWSLYALKCAEYLLNGNKRGLKIYKFLYILALFSAPYLSLKLAWALADICNAFLCLPNLIALWALSGKLKKETDSFFGRNAQISACFRENKQKKY